VVTVSARREVVCFLRDRKRLSERRALAVLGMSPSVLRYARQPDLNSELRGKVVELAHRHRRHGYRMIHMRLRLEGWPVNVKRVYRLYREENLMVRRRRRRKLPQLERQPFGRPAAPNEVWSMDFLFDEISDGRRMKCLAIVDDCSKESVGLEADTSIPGAYVTRVLDRIRTERGLPRAIRMDNGPEFTGKAMALWAATNGVELRFIEPGKPIQNAYVESFNGRFREECLSEHWFTSLAHARSIIAAWRHDYNERRPHSALGYVPPARFAARCLALAPDSARSDRIINSDSRSECS
jgi:putative transposase